MTFATAEATAQIENDRSLYESLVRVSQTIGAHRDPDELFGALANELRHVIRFDSIGVIQYDATGTLLHWHLAEKCGKIVEEQCPGVSQEGSIHRWVYESQEAVVIPYVERETRFRLMLDLIGQCGIRSVCALPLTTIHRRLGVLFLGCHEAGVFSESDIPFLSLVANQIALATDDALNFKASQLAQERLTLLLNLTNSVVSNLDLRELVRAAAPSIRHVMHCDAIGVHLPDAQVNQLKLYALDFPEARGALDEDILVPIEGTPPGDAFRTGKPVLFNASDANEIDPESRCRIVEEGIKCACLLPLISRNRVLGVLGLARREEKPFAQSEVDFSMQIANQVAIAVENALAYGQITELKDKLAQEKLYLEDEIRSEMNFDEIVGKSAILRRLLKQVETVAPTNSTVLIYGETGTGKELIARALHNLSPRKPNAFVKLNCAAIPTGLLESELFGHEKGAFTGAIAQRIGRFELANGGTVFLDEIGEIPLELQPKLLRVLQEREFERLGNGRTLRTDARLIAATNRDLSVMVQEQKFRSDLFYRLNVFPVRVPPLRERPEDVPLLVRHFVQQFARSMNRRIDSISSETMNAMSEYHWPGNIRELQNVVERAVILSSGPVLRIALSDFKANGPSPSESAGASGPAGRRNVQRILDETERKQILAALKESQGVVAGPNGAANLLGMKRSTLQQRMHKLGITRRSAAV